METPKRDASTKRSQLTVQDGVPKAPAIENANISTSLQQQATYEYIERSGEAEVRELEKDA